MPKITLPYQQKYALADLLSLKDKFIWLHTKTNSGQEFDLLVFEPKWSVSECSGEDIENIKKLVDKFPNTEKHDSGFFNGGLVGYIGYSFSREQAHNKPSKRKTKAKFRLPPDLHIGYYPTNYFVIDHNKQIITGDVAEPALFSANQWAEYSDLQILNNKDSQFRLTSSFSQVWTRSAYKAAYEKIKDYLLQGDCYQVNLAQMLTAEYHGHPFTIFKKVIALHKTPNFAYVKTGRGDVLSFSPENFLSIGNNYICTKPIKGTRQRHADPAEDRVIAQGLLASSKDRAENVMIVDLLRNDLGRIAKTGSVTVKQLCELESFSNVHHLISLICAELKEGISPFEALLTCSPGGSITGAPKIRAMEIIDELEDFPRNVYCGSIFFCAHNGHLESNIAIRTVTCRDGQVSVWGGGGIVADSIESAEYEESLFKISHIISVLSETLIDQ